MKNLTNKKARKITTVIFNLIYDRDPSEIELSHYEKKLTQVADFDEYDIICDQLIDDEYKKNKAERETIKNNKKKLLNKFMNFIK